MVKTLQKEDSKETKKQEKKITIEKVLMNEKEAAHRYCISVKWLRNQRQLGKGPPFKKFNRNVRYNIHETDQWIDSHTTQPSDDTSTPLVSIINNDLNGDDDE